VYIEGDGRAWATRRRPAQNPTPSDALGLRLAARDRSPSVLYVARPCQFVEGERRTGCEQRYWTSHRYGEAVVGAIDEVIDRAVGAGAPGPPAAAGSARRVVLVGYSGGGTVAALVAARRRDVACLITVAANLDVGRWAQSQALSPLSGSLDPAQASGALAAVAQVHLAGGADATVPPTLLEGYLDALGPGAGALGQVVDGFDHRCCWEGAWPGLLGRLEPAPAPACILPRSTATAR
jgi:pimeloyl-ACP methyl ester carboxylesterase